MVETPKRKVRGLGRVAFIANLPAIKTELAEGWTAKSIYDRHADKLAGKISYPQFIRYVRALRNAPSNAKPPAPAASVPAAIAQPSPLPATGNPAHARHEPARPRTFEHDGNPRQDDEDRLIFGNRTGPKK